MSRVSGQVADTPSVGVVVPVYRVERYVRACVAAIARQSVRPDQVVLVDDAGGDASMDVALAAAREHDLDVEVVTHPQNRGLSAARNAGLRALRTDLVWFCDSDDDASEHFVEKMVAALVAADAAMVVCRTARIADDRTILAIEEQPYGAAVTSGAEVAGALLRSGVRGYACNKVMRRDLLGAAPFPEGKVYEDVAPLLRLALTCRRIALIDDPLYLYRVNETSISRAFGPHIVDLLGQEADVRAILADAGLLDDRQGIENAWRADFLRYRYVGVVLPAANMALRARTAASEAGDVDPTMLATIERTVDGARALICDGDIRDLWRTGARRQALTVAVLRRSPRVYERILAQR